MPALTAADVPTAAAAATVTLKDCVAVEKCRGEERRGKETIHRYS
jgi:hypothetical protein